MRRVRTTEVVKGKGEVPRDATRRQLDRLLRRPTGHLPKPHKVHRATDLATLALENEVQVAVTVHVDSSPFHRATSGPQQMTKRTSTDAMRDSALRRSSCAITSSTATPTLVCLHPYVSPVTARTRSTTIARIDES